jgi:hypothetical protein
MLEAWLSCRALAAVDGFVFRAEISGKSDPISHSWLSVVTLSGKLVAGIRVPS